MELHFKFWIYAMLAILTIASFLLMVYTYKVGQYESTIKLMIVGAIALATLLLCIWIWKK